MNKDIFVILKDEEKVREIRRIASKYGVRLTSGILISICILLTSGSSYRKSDSKVQNIENLQADLAAISSRMINLKPFPVIVNDNQFSYDEVKEPTFEEKINIILDKYNLTREELDVCSAIACAEANGEGMNYEEAVNVICAAYNRTISSTWVSSLGNNLYDQMAAPSQFVVYENGNYLNYLGRTDLPGYQAVIDFLSNNCEVEAHNYLSFRSNNSNINGVELVSGGNLYFNELDAEERLADIRVQEEVTRVLS